MKLYFVLTAIFCALSVPNWAQQPQGVAQTTSPDPLVAFSNLIQRTQGALNNAIKIGYVVNGKPESRTFWYKGMRDGGPTFSVSEKSAFGKQIQGNPNVVMTWTGANNEGDINDVRLYGQIEQVGQPKSGYYDYRLRPDSATFTTIKSGDMSSAEVVNFKKSQNGTWTSQPPLRRIMPSR